MASCVASATAGPSVAKAIEGGLAGNARAGAHPERVRPGFLLCPAPTTDHQCGQCRAHWGSCGGASDTCCSGSGGRGQSTHSPVKYLRPGPQFERTTFDGLAPENPEPFSLGERAVDRSDCLPENDREHTGPPRLGVEPVAGRLAEYRDLHVQGRFLSGPTRLTRAQPAPVGPVRVAKLTDVAVTAVPPKYGRGGRGRQHLCDPA